MRRPRQVLKVAVVLLAAALCAAALASQEVSGREPPLREMRAGQSALQRGDFPAAKAAFERAAEAAPEFPDAFLGMGLAALRSGELVQAVSSLQRTTELSPGLKGAHLFLGIAQYQTGQADAAVASLGKELALAPDNLEALVWLGIVDLGREHPEEAVAPLDHAAALSPANAQVLYYQARAHKAMAKDAMHRLYELDPDSLLVHRALGESFSESGELEKAIVEFEAALRKDPQNPDLYELLADEQSKLARYADAGETYRKELALNPHSAIALYNLGRIDVEHGKPAEGVEELRRAAEAHARPAPTMYYLGFGLVQLGKDAEAVEALEAALASGPSPFVEQGALFQLARCYGRMGRKADADRALARLKALKASTSPGVSAENARSGPGSALTAEHP